MLLLRIIRTILVSAFVYIGWPSLDGYSREASVTGEIDEHHSKSCAWQAPGPVSVTSDPECPIARPVTTDLRARSVPVSILAVRDDQRSWARHGEVVNAACLSVLPTRVSVLHDNTQPLPEYSDPFFVVASACRKLEHQWMARDNLLGWSKHTTDKIILKDASSVIKETSSSAESSTRQSGILLPGSRDEQVSIHALNESGSCSIVLEREADRQGESTVVGHGHVATRIFGFDEQPAAGKTGSGRFVCAHECSPLKAGDDDGDDRGERDYTGGYRSHDNTSYLPAIFSLGLGFCLIIGGYLRLVLRRNSRREILILIGALLLGAYFTAHATILWADTYLTSQGIPKDYLIPSWMTVFSSISADATSPEKIEVPPTIQIFG